ncbi:chemotaxis protein methyltransferase CheR [Dorea sp. 5-2]|jgi:chemotaxis protein methyltransferase CheR|nr:chemotaxis protein methyltransferase CheR [Dorea sp. 5-2]MCI9025557.1 protein-glutamate O-methyltransferase CheR [Dorea sp.]MDE6829942.1 protein-glutamate O-methyltransferase CheR [Lachnospiraceae bacterium]
MLTINDRDFQRLVTFVHQNYGIDLSKKRQLILGRLSNTILSMGFSSFEEYIDNLIKNKKPEDLELMLNKLTTNYTFFMRESAHFDLFRDTILPYLVETKKDKVLSIWSAACSSGEEPYTISMILKEFFGAKASAWDTRVLATDISQNALVAAKNAVYEEDSLKELSPTWKSKYFRQTGQPGVYTVAPEIKSNVIFRTFNLMDPIKFRLKFDVIFCRNVMIYFDQPTKDALVKRFYDATNPGGYLLIGHSESLNKATTPYKYLKPATYRKM